MEIEYYQTKESVNEYLKAAEGFDGTYLIEKLKSFLKPNTDFLELGSGPGKDWEILSKNFSVVGSDNSKEFLNRLISKFPNGEFLNLNAATLYTSQNFDCIYSNKVLHHLTNEELNQSIKRQAKILNPNGIICHSFWKGKGTETFKGMFVNYHSKDGLKSIIKPYFELLLLEEYKEFEEGDSILLIGKTKP